MLCAVGRPLRLATWLALPFLFSSAVLGLTGLGGLLVGVSGSLALSSALFGAGVAVGVTASGMVAWTAPWQRVWLRWPYLALVMLAGIGLHGVRVPVVAVVCVGVPVNALLVVHYFLERRRTAALAEAGQPAGSLTC